MLRTLLATRAIHFLVTRFGPSRLRGMAFDEKYRRGDWRFHADGDTLLRDTVLQYVREGDLFIAGCGSASILQAVDPSTFNSVLGIDLSSEAIKIATRFVRPNVSFAVADMRTFECPAQYDAILFSESLYYLSPSVQDAALDRYGAHLKPDGVFIVTLADSQRFSGIVKRINERFAIVEDRRLDASSRRLLVFRPSTNP